MTITAAWIRGAPAKQELVFASDSRVTGGQIWDRVPKLYEFPRTDCAMSLAGSTLFTFPMAQQLITSVGSYGPSRRRSADLRTVQRHALRVFNEMYKDFREWPSDDHHPQAQFTFGGWSWQRARYEISYIEWNERTSEFDFRPVEGRIDRPNVVAFFSGDALTMLQAHIALGWLLHERRVDADAPLDLEPLEIVHALIESDQYRDIGGAPQVLKVYRSMNVQQFVVEWSPDGQSEAKQYFAGRPLLVGEKIHAPVFKLPPLADDARLALRAAGEARPELPASYQFPWRRTRG